MDYSLNEGTYSVYIDDLYRNKLDLEGFSLMMKDPSYCYKFYWLEAIVVLISEGVQQATFDEVINEMICNAWYSVREFHIHLSGLRSDGMVRDGLERAIIKLSEVSNLSASASKIEIKNAIKEYDNEIRTEKTQLTNMVPYRALTGFMPPDNPIKNDESKSRVAAYIEKLNSGEKLLPYIFGESSGLKKELFFQSAWSEMIKDNTVSILGWIRYEKVKWLQNNNPEVPGLVYKLIPMDEKMRRLGKVRELWEIVLNITEVMDVFTEKAIVPKKYDVDHFIPWSFVMNDELWNLMPMDSSLNSSKSNRLPQWNPFFKRFANNQFLLYGLIHEIDSVHKKFEECYKDNLHSIWAGQELYRKGNSRDEFYGILQKNMEPLYDSARRQGYELWNRV